MLTSQTSPNSKYFLRTIPEIKFSIFSKVPNTFSDFSPDAEKMCQIPTLNPFSNSPSSSSPFSFMMIHHPVLCPSMQSPFAYDPSLQYSQCLPVFKPSSVYLPQYLFSSPSLVNPSTKTPFLNVPVYIIYWFILIPIPSKIPSCNEPNSKNPFGEIETPHINSVPFSFYSKKLLDICCKIYDL